jgi:Flp pilus assembly protein TadD
MERTIEFLKEQGNSLLRDGNVQGAIANYTMALELSPRNVPLLSNRAAAYSRLNPPDWGAAHTDAKNATDTDPSFWKAWSRRGLASLELGNPRDALIEF